MPRWPRVLIRTSGLLSAIVGVGGLFSMSTLVLLPRKYTVAPTLHLRYYSLAFFNKLAMGIGLNFALMGVGLVLWRVGRLGRILANALFVTEIAYFFGKTFGPLWLRAFGGGAAAFGNAAAAAALGDMGIALHMITAFPLLGLLAVNLGYWRLNRRKAGTGTP